MPARAVVALVAASVVAPSGGIAVAATPQAPWADPIGTSPPSGTAPGVPSVPYAQPIGASRLNPTLAVPPRPLAAPPARRCHRVLDAGRVVTRCTVSR